MIKFGLSAFLKIASLNEKRQRQEITKRLRPSGSAYDFHRNFRLGARRYLLDASELKQVIATINSLNNGAERKAARVGLARLIKWRNANTGVISVSTTAIYESPARTFAVRFAPDFAIDVDGDPIAIHIWNTKAPALSDRMTYATLELFRNKLNADGRTIEPAVLDLRTSTLLVLSDVDQQAAQAKALVSAIEYRIGEANEVLRSTPLGPRPPSPPPLAL